MTSPLPAPQFLPLDSDYLDEIKLESLRLIPSPSNPPEHLHMSHVLRDIDGQDGALDGGGSQASAQEGTGAHELVSQQDLEVVSSPSTLASISP